MFCRNCGKEIDNKALVCVHCGCSPYSDKKFCQNCGEAVDPSAVACVKCGVQLRTTPQTGKSKLAAGLMGILIPGLGIQRFYLGYTTMGILQILATVATCGIGAVWGLIDGILILTGKVATDADGNPLTD